MKLKRLVASVSAGFEEFVSKVENHEAVADSMIDDARKAAARIRVQMGRANAQMVRLRAELASTERDVRLWQQRAVAISEEDPERALACIQRLEDAERRQQALRQQRDEHEAVAADLTAALRDVEARIRDLELRRTNLSSREARASLSRVEDSHCGTFSTAERAFERWESAVIEDEYRGGVALAGDSLEHEFTADERRERLRARLAELTAAKSARDTDQPEEK